MKQTILGMVDYVVRDLITITLIYGIFWLIAKGVVREAWNMAKETYLWSNVRWL